MWVASPYLQHQHNEHRDGVKLTPRRPPPLAVSVARQNHQHHQHLNSHPLHEELVVVGMVSKRILALRRLHPGSTDTSTIVSANVAKAILKVLSLNRCRIGSGVVIEVAE